MIKGIFSFYCEMGDYIEPAYNVIESKDPTIPRFGTVGADAFKVREASIPSTPSLEDWLNAGRPVLRLG